MNAGRLIGLFIIPWAFVIFSGAALVAFVWNPGGFLWPFCMGLFVIGPLAYMAGYLSVRRGMA